MIERSDAEAMLRFLLVAERPGFTASGAALTGAARANVVTVRLAQALGSAAPPEVAASAERERDRISSAVATIEALGRACADTGLPHAFVKAFQHYPDMGHDIDLLVEGSAAADRRVLSGLSARETPRGTFDLVSGKRGYQLGRSSTPLEVHHGRLGIVGEHRALAERILQNAATESVAGIACRMPTRGDMLIVQAVQRVYGHGSLRLSDVLRTVDLLSATDLGEVVAVSRKLGVHDGLRLYLGGVDRLVRAATGGGLRLPSGLVPSAVPLIFDGSVHRFPRRSILGVFARSLLAAASRGDAATSFRLCSVPPLAVVAVMRARLRRRHSGL